MAGTNRARAIATDSYKEGLMLQRYRLLFVLGLAGLTAGCFGFLGGGGPEYTATVVVRNDIDPPRSLSIDLRQVGGDTETLGTVASGEERTMDFTSDDLQGTYQLIARQTSGAAVTSREFTLFPNARVQWQLRANAITVTEPR
jgi:hypothetical protein